MTVVKIGITWRGTDCHSCVTGVTRELSEGLEMFWIMFWKVMTWAYT